MAKMLQFNEEALKSILKRGENSCKSSHRHLGPKRTQCRYQ